VKLYSFYLPVHSLVRLYDNQRKIKDYLSAANAKNLTKARELLIAKNWVRFGFELGFDLVWDWFA
jgi:hypothetical protein